MAMRQFAPRSVLILAFSAGATLAAASLNYLLDPAVIAPGAGSSTSASFLLTGTIGQTGSGVASSATYIQSSGFAALVSNGGGGTVLDSDSFSSSLGPNWSVVSGTWGTSSGALLYTAAGAGPDSLRSNGPLTANAWIEVQVTVASGSPVAGVVFRAASSTLDGQNQCWVEMDYGAQAIRLRKDVAGVRSDIASAVSPLQTGATYTLRVKFAGNDMRVLIDNVQKICASDTSITASGYYGLQVRGGAGVAFDDWSVVTASNSVPVANAGADQNLTGSAPVLLDGTGSYDGDGDPLNFTWTQVSGPAVTLSNPTAAAPTFVPTVGMNTFTFKLVVDDCLNASPPDTVSMTVDVASPPAAASGGGGGGGGCGLIGLEALLFLGLCRRRAHLPTFGRGREVGADVFGII